MRASAGSETGVLAGEIYSAKEADVRQREMLSFITDVSKSIMTLHPSWIKPECTECPRHNNPLF